MRAKMLYRRACLFPVILLKYSFILLPPRSFVADLSFDPTMASTSNEEGAITLAMLDNISLSPEEIADVEKRQEGQGGVTDCVEQIGQRIVGYTCAKTGARIFLL